MRIGVFDLSSAGWTASGVYSRMVATSLAHAGGPTERITVLHTTDAPPAWTASLDVDTLAIPPFPFRRFLPGEARLSGALGRGPLSFPTHRWVRAAAALSLGERAAWLDLADAHHLDVVLPVTQAPPQPGRCRVVGWVPDFQHARLPQLFPPENQHQRTVEHDALVQRCDHIIVSSHACHHDLVDLHPAAQGKSSVHPFPSMHAWNEPLGDAAEIQALYHLPERFALVPNQFWSHKNHKVVVDAVALLKERGVELTVAMTGLPREYRSSTNAPISELLQHVSKRNVRPQVAVLGLVPRAHLDALTRAATVVVQPSMFEGWSTSVQDARALGRPLLCSDLPVHHEQAPDALGYFATDRPDVLADLLGRHWQQLQPGPDPLAEEAARTREAAYALRHGQALLATLRGLLSRADR